MAFKGKIDVVSFHSKEIYPIITSEACSILFSASEKQVNIRSDQCERNFLSLNQFCTTQ